MARSNGNDRKLSKSPSTDEMRRRAGEKVANVTTPVRFYKNDAKKARLEKEDGEIFDEVDIPVRIDPSGGNERSNTTKVTFTKIASFAEAGEAVIELRRDLEVKIYKPMGLVGPDKFVSRLRYLFMTLGTTATQQLSKAVTESFKWVSASTDATMKDEEREDISVNDKKICEWLAKPAQALWDGLSPERKKEKIETANTMMENHVWFHLYKLVYPEMHSEALNLFDKYIKTQLIKPRGWTITTTRERISELIDLRQFIPPPGDDVITALYDAPKTPLTKGERRQLEFDLLPKEWQTRVKGQMINWLNKPELEWDRTLRQVEQEVQLHEKQQEKKKKATKVQDDSDSSKDERVSRARKRAKSLAHKKKSYGKVTPKGKAKFCAYCKSKNRSEEAYTSHNESECFLKNKYERGFSGDRRAKAEAQNHFEKAIKKQSRQLKEMRKVMKTMARSSGKREAKAAAAKADQDTISGFINDSDSDVSMSSDSD